MGRLALLVLVLLPGLPACRITPEAIEKIQVENDLLRQQIHTIKENCEYYREVEVEPAPREEE